MNALAVICALAAGVAAVGLVLVWIAKRPGFDISKILVQGDTQRNNVATLRANVLPRLSGNFFSLDLAQARATFEQMPWVRAAVVQRQFPNTLRVVLQEHQPVAFFGLEGDSRLVNNFGEVFTANSGEVVEEMPRLSGSESEAFRLLEVLGLARQVLARLDFEVEQLELSPSGAWRVWTNDGALIELGRGDVKQMVARLESFTRSLPFAAAQMRRQAIDFEYADLRYPQGFALKLRGVRTQAGSTRGDGGATPPVAVRSNTKP